MPSSYRFQKQGLRNELSDSFSSSSTREQDLIFCAGKEEALIGHNGQNFNSSPAASLTQFVGEKAGPVRFQEEGRYPMNANDSNILSAPNTSLKLFHENGKNCNIGHPTSAHMVHLACSNPVMNNNYSICNPQLPPRPNSTMAQVTPILGPTPFNTDLTRFGDHHGFLPSRHSDFLYHADFNTDPYENNAFMSERMFNMPKNVLVSSSMNQPRIFQGRTDF